MPVITSDNYPLDNNITIFNVYSYPSVGGTWIVRFTTVGKADLVISAVNGTSWSDCNNNCDLRFLELKCGNETLDYEWIDDSVLIKDYSSDKVCFESCRVLTSGSHTLIFQFGDDIAYAFNDASNWWNSNWYARKLITINSSLVDDNLYNFPIMINVTDSDLANKAQGDGDDIAFVLHSDNNTQLNHEIELFNDTTGHLLAWVNVTSLSGSVDTKIWMYYNNSICNSQQNVSGVWDSNYVLVQHLNETSGTHYDSTSYWNNGTNQNSNQDSQGVIDGANQFDGTNDWIQIGDNSSLEGMQKLTIEAWIYDTGDDTNPRGITSKRVSSSSQRSFSLFLYSNRQIYLDVGTDRDSSSSSLQADQWTYVVATFDGSLASQRKKFYFDGSYDSSAECTPASIPSTNSDLHIGILNANYGNSWLGKIDEVRLSDTIRNTSWINTTFNTINNQDNFLNFSIEETSIPTASNPVPNDGATNINIPPYSFNITISDPNGDNMNITWRTNASGSWITFNNTDGGGSGVGDGTYNATNTSWVDSHSTKYWWSINLTDGTSWTNETYSFTTSYQPQLSSTNPVNGSYSVPTPICRVTVSDQDEVTVTVRFYENSSNPTVWVLQQTNNSVDVTTPATVVWKNYSNATGYNIKYWWKVNVSDDKDVFKEEIYHFITSPDNPPIQSNENPIDQVTGIPTNLSSINVTISDPDGDTMNWSIETSPNIGSNSGNDEYNGSISCSISGLEAASTYYWYVNVTDGIMWTNETYSFTTSYPANIALIAPAPNGTTGVSSQPTCQIWANDTEGDSLSVTWATNASGSWENKYTNSSVVANTTVSYQFTDFNNYGTTYYWKVYVNDSSSNVSEWYYLITDVISTSIDLISPYEQTNSTITISASGSSDLSNVTLWYIYTTDNSTWWNLSWSKRKPINFNVSTGATPQNYQVLLNITYDSDMNSDFSDLRFINYSDGSTELDYWIENKSDGNWAQVWVEITENITATSQSHAWVYYGNTDATSQSNGGDTFVLFDDFLGTSFDDSIWGTNAVEGTEYDISSGLLEMWGAWNAGGGDHYFATDNSFASPIIAQARARISSISSDMDLSFGFQNSQITEWWTDANCVWCLFDSNGGGGANRKEVKTNGVTDGGNEATSTSWENHIIEYLNTGVNYYDSNLGWLNTTRSTFTPFYLSLAGDSDSGSKVYVDYIFLRKYNSENPTYSIGSENCWIKWNNTYNPDAEYPWSWNFDFTNGSGYYEFYSIGKKDGSTDETPPSIADAICYYNLSTDIPVINSYNLTNITGSKLNNATGLIEVNKEYTFSVNITDTDGWADIDYINVTAWYDNGSETSSYNETLGGNLNMFLQYRNTTGTGNWRMLWPDNEATLILTNCSETIIDANTREINFSFIPGSQIRWANSNYSWLSTKNATNDPYSWNFNITVSDTGNRTDYKRDEYGVYRYTSVSANSDWVDVFALPGFSDDSSIVTISYSSNYDFNMSIYFEENLTHTMWPAYTISIADNVTINADADPDDDIISDQVFGGIGESFAVDIFNVSGLFMADGLSQTVDVQFNVFVPFGTMGGKYTACVATKISHD